MTSLLVPTSRVEEVAHGRSEANRACARIDGKVALAEGASLDLLGAAGEIAFARHLMVPDIVVAVNARTTDPGWDFWVAGWGKVDIKTTSFARRSDGRWRALIYPEHKYPPRVPPDYLVLAYAAQMGEWYQVQLVGYCTFGFFDAGRQKIAMQPKPAWGMWPERLLPFGPGAFLW